MTHPKPTNITPRQLLLADLQARHLISEIQTARLFVAIYALKDEKEDDESAISFATRIVNEKAPPNQ